MSLSNPTNISQNPAKKFIEFKEGGFRYYDKATKAYVPVPLPVTFTVLDELSTITGYDERNNCGIYANEVWSTTKTKMVVKSFKGGEIAEGFYSQIKDTVKARGGRYAKSVYAYMNGELVNFKFVGASLSPWIDKEFDVTKQSVQISELGEGQKGKTVYQFPIFKAVPMQDLEAAMAADKELQKYLKDKIESPKTEPVTKDDFYDEPPVDASESSIAVEDLPW